MAGRVLGSDASTARDEDSKRHSEVGLSLLPGDRDAPGPSVLSEAFCTGSQGGGRLAAPTGSLPGCAQGYLAAEAPAAAPCALCPTPGCPSSPFCLSLTPFPWPLGARLAPGEWVSPGECGHTAVQGPVTAPEAVAAPPDQFCHHYQSFKKTMIYSYLQGRPQRERQRSICWFT